MGVTSQEQKGDAEAIPFLKRAIELDPNFAMAYARLAVSYGNLGQPSLAAENLKRAYALRDRVSEREKFHILPTTTAGQPGNTKKKPRLTSCGSRVIRGTRYRTSTSVLISRFSGNTIRSFRKLEKGCGSSRISSGTATSDNTFLPSIDWMMPKPSSTRH